MGQHDDDPPVPGTVPQPGPPHKPQDCGSVTVTTMATVFRMENNFMAKEHPNSYRLSDKDENESKLRANDFIYF